MLVAAGAWAPSLLARIGVHLAVAPQRGQIVHLRLARHRYRSLARAAAAQQATICWPLRMLASSSARPARPIPVSTIA